MTPTPPGRTVAAHPPVGPPPAVAVAAVAKPGPVAEAPVKAAGPGAPPRMWTLELPAGLKVLSLNGRIHWSEQRRRAAELKKAAWAMAPAK